MLRLEKEQVAVLGCQEEVCFCLDARQDDWGPRALSLQFETPRQRAKDPLLGEAAGSRAEHRREGAIFPSRQ
jgi:hypothetical protein